MHDNLTEVLFEEDALLQEAKAPPQITACRIAVGKTPTTYRHEPDLAAAAADEGSEDLCIDIMTRQGYSAKGGCPQLSCGCMVHVSKKQFTCVVYKSRTVLKQSEDGG